MTTVKFTQFHTRQPLGDECDRQQISTTGYSILSQKAKLEGFLQRKNKAGFKMPLPSCMAKHRPLACILGKCNYPGSVWGHNNSCGRNFFGWLRKRTVAMTVVKYSSRNSHERGIFNKKRTRAARRRMRDAG